MIDPPNNWSGLSALDAYRRPDLVPIRRNLTAVCFRFMKVLPAMSMVARGLGSGEVRPGGTVVESSSGNFALGLALACAAHDLNFVLVTADTQLDAPLRRRLEALGTRIDLVRSADAPDGVQKARLRRLEEIRRANPEYFWPRQYDNPENCLSYAALADQLIGVLDRIDVLVGTVGSGGSMSGATHFLRLAYPNLQSIAIDSQDSVTFGLPGRERLLRGLGSDVMPKNVRHDLFDWVHWVSPADAFGATRQLHARHLLYQGPTSGAAFLVADWIARNNPHLSVVAIMPDDGHRYAETVYDDDWLTRRCLSAAWSPTEPTSVAHPTRIVPGWCRYRWRRRPLEAVMGAGAVPNAPV